MESNSLGKILRERRKAKGLSQSQLSRMSGVSFGHISHIETGERFPSGHVLRKLAEPLGFGGVELLKLAGFLSQDDTDERIERLRQELKDEIAKTLAVLYEKIDEILEGEK